MSLTVFNVCLNIVNKNQHLDFNLLNFIPVFINCSTNKFSIFKLTTRKISLHFK